MGEYERRGDKSKCPACGWSLDEGAYRCPKCRIYFCYKCRARVGRQEQQYQCADQSCICYGKLLCSACTVMVEQCEPEEIDTTSFLAKSLHLVGIIIAVGGPIYVGDKYGWGWGIAAFIAVAVIGVPLVVLLEEGAGLKFERKQVVQRVVAQHRSCIQCRHPVKCL